MRQYFIGMYFTIVVILQVEITVYEPLDATQIYIGVTKLKDKPNACCSIFPIYYMILS